MLDYQDSVKFWRPFLPGVLMRMKSPLKTTWQSLAAPPSHPGKTAWAGDSAASFWSSHYWMIIQNTSLWEPKMWALRRWSQTTYSSMGRLWCWWTRTRDMGGHWGHLADSPTPLHLLSSLIHMVNHIWYISSEISNTFSQCLRSSRCGEDSGPDGI